MKGTFKEKTTRLLAVCRVAFFMGIGSVGGVLAVDVTPAEVYWLTYIHGEEKFARDVYTFLYAIWGSTIFNDIAGSELM